jgi:hypothetical protein
MGVAYPGIGVRYVEVCKLARVKAVGHHVIQNPRLTPTPVSLPNKP